jgi:hypothetical protein
MAKSKSQNKLIKFSAASIGIILVGCSIAWYAGIQKAKEIDTKLIEYLEKQGFKVDRSEPTYSGFPFKITQKTEHFLAIQEDKEVKVTIKSENATASAWIFNPIHFEFDGKTTLSFTHKSKQPIQLSFNKAVQDISLDKKGNLVQKSWTVNDINFQETNTDVVIAKVKEIAFESDSKHNGDKNTEIQSEITIKDIELSTKTKPLVIDKVKLKGKITSKFETYNELRSALSKFDDELSEQISQNCQTNQNHLPPIGDTIKELEETKANASGEIEIKIDKFKLKLAGDIKVKDGFPEFDAKLVLDDFDKMTQSLVESGTIDASTEQLTRLSLSAVADRDASDGDYVINASLKDKTLMLGKNKIREFKEIDWNNIPVPNDFCQKRQNRLETSQGLMLQGLSPYISYPVF